MKIATEILDHLDVHADLFGGLDPGYVRQQRAFLESLIAAKLEPVRDTIMHVLSEEQFVLGKQSQNDLAEAIALFEDAP